ncbi:putative lipoprotein YmbA [Rhodoferax ferrireducens]|uniref:Lipoprotein YmbA n=1 Tax=Rhodoferax ferrireducens TaxID=192843 RepID=A0ABU2CDQ0_9BURK|nr:PqiC family protein [Rhodoferax ferrireducens]MDR7379469.1 putative lipoprotein YmbA [Rhodoferax ferrireducens]
MSLFRPSLALLAVVSLAALAGCGSTPAVRYYSLSTATAAAATTTAPTAKPLLIEVPPLALPERLVRPQLVVRTAANQVDVLELHRWTAPFDSELRDALASSIAARLGAVDVSGGGRLAGQPVYRVAVQLRQWEAVDNSRVEASFSWTIRRSDEARNIACQWSQSVPVGAGIAALAQGAQQLTAQAAQRMAASLSALDADAAAQCPA